MLATVITVPVSIVSTLLLARWLGPAEFGSFAIFTLILALVPSLLDLGVTDALQRKSALAVGAEDAPLLARYVAMLQGWGLAKGAITVAIGFVVLPPGPATLFAGSVLITALVTGVSTALSVSLRLYSLVLTRFVGTVVGVAAALVVASENPSADWVFATQTLATAVPTLLLLVAGRRGAFPGTYLRPAVPRLSRKDVTFSLTAWFNTQIADLVGQRTELLFFTPEQKVERGAFALGLSATSRVTIAIDALYAPLSTGLAIRRGQSLEALRRATAAGFRLTTALILSFSPVLLAVSVFVALPVSGSEYRGEEIGFGLLTLGALLGSALHPLYSYYYATRTTLPTTVGSVLGLVLNVGLSFALIPAFGFPGAIIAKLAGSLALLLTLVAFGRRDAGVRAMLNRHLTWVSLALVAAAVPAWLVLTLVDGTYARMAVSGVAALVVTAALLRWSPVLFAADVTRLVDALPGRVRPLARRGATWMPLTGEAGRTAGEIDSPAGSLR
nr:polysaccharide biosynthesis C-terminal domain-containing protein [Motilibacter aurantiacus]